MSSAGLPVRFGRQPCQQVTVLFADMVHSMSIAAAVGSERLREIAVALGVNPVSQTFLAEQLGTFAIRKQRRLQQSLSVPNLAVDMVGDGIRVIDPNGRCAHWLLALRRSTASSTI
jgi:hypothetical protein